MSTDKLVEITEEDKAKVVKEEKKTNKTKQLIYMIVYDPKEESHFKIVPIEFKHLSYKHPLIKRTGAIFADHEYAKQFYNFVVTNAKKVDEERKKAACETLERQFEEQKADRIINK